MACFLSMLPRRLIMPRETENSRNRREDTERRQKLSASWAEDQRRQEEAEDRRRQEQRGRLLRRTGAEALREATPAPRRNEPDGGKKTRSGPRKKNRDRASRASHDYDVTAAAFDWLAAQRRAEDAAYGFCVGINQCVGARRRVDGTYVVEVLISTQARGLTSARGPAARRTRGVRRGEA